MKAQIMKGIRAGLTLLGLPALLKRVVLFFFRMFPSLEHSFRPESSEFGAVLSPGIESAEILKALYGIPTETTEGERRFLYRFMKTVWGGQNDVIEIGPFLGGTTRALALGMEENPLRKKSAKLHTYDKFSEYCEPQKMLDYLSWHFKSGKLPKAFKAKIQQSSQFKDLFDFFHSNQSYGSFLRSHAKSLPDTPAQAAELADSFKTPKNAKYEVVFVDGCKSWYGTKYFMMELANKVERGSYFIFQDYGWFSCFWIPAFLHTFREHFELLCYIDNTYTFRLKKTLTKKTIQERFPDDPKQFSNEKLKAIFESLSGQAQHRNDAHAENFYKLQYAASLAYLGQIERARRIIVALKKAKRLCKYRRVIELALEGPTYRPGGEKISLEPT